MNNSTLNFLLQHAAEDPVSFHMPGHKGSQLYRRFGYDKFLNNIMDCDITEIPGADNLFQREGILKATCDTYSRLYEVDHSYMLINGTSGGIIAAIGLNFLVTTKHGGIELSASQIITPYLFYPATFLGINYCLALAKVISTFKYSRKLFAYVGKNSFHIMALHFVCLKLVDVIYGLITNQPPEIYSKFPFAFDLWYIYYPVGIFLPLGIIELCKLLKKYTALGIS
jgi:hypothetical protein